MCVYVCLLRLFGYANAPIVCCVLQTLTHFLVVILWNFNQCMNFADHIEFSPPWINFHIKILSAHLTAVTSSAEAFFLSLSHKEKRRKCSSSFMWKRVVYSHVCMYERDRQWVCMNTYMYAFVFVYNEYTYTHAWKSRDIKRKSNTNEAESRNEKYAKPYVYTYA